MKTLAALLICSFLITLPLRGEEKQPTTANASKPSTYQPVHEYDPKRDASKDIRDAIAEAGRTKKNVLVEVGGKWCVWCGYLDKFFEQNATLRNFRDDNFVMVKVNWSPENKNEKLLEKYPAISGYPHIFVLDMSGKLLHSQDTSKLEEGRGYSVKSIAAFLQEWVPKK